MKFQNERGVAIVEAALTILPFFMLVFGIVEAGRLLNVQQVLTNAAREGARLGVAPYSGTATLPTVEEVEAQVQRFLDSANIQGAEIEVERPVEIPVGGILGEYTRVKVSVPYNVITIAPFSALEIVLQGKALMRNETSP